MWFSSTLTFKLMIFSIYCWSWSCQNHVLTAAKWWFSWFYPFLSHLLVGILFKRWVSLSLSVVFCVCLSLIASSAGTVHCLFRMMFLIKTPPQKDLLIGNVQLARHSNLRSFVHGVFQRLNEEGTANYLHLSFQECRFYLLIRKLMNKVIK